MLNHNSAVKVRAVESRGIFAVLRRVALCCGRVVRCGAVWWCARARQRRPIFSCESMYFFSDTYGMSFSLLTIVCALCMPQAGVHQARLVGKQQQVQPERVVVSGEGRKRFRAFQSFGRSV